MNKDQQTKDNEHSFDTGIKTLAGLNRLSPLRRYLFTIGKTPDPKKISKEELIKIENSSRYKQWKILRKLQHMAAEIKKRENKVNEELNEAAPNVKLDIGDPSSKRHIKHKTRQQKLKYIKQQVISSVGKGLGDVITDPAAITTKNVKAQHAFKAMGKGKILVRKTVGHRPQHTYRFQEDITVMAKEEQPQTENKKDIVNKDVSDKTRKVLDKSKELKLKTGTIEINPQIHVSKSNFDRKD